MVHDVQELRLEGRLYSVIVLEDQRNDAPVTTESYVITEDDVRGLIPVDVSNHPYRFLKRALDIVLSVLGLAVLLLPLAVLALVIYIDNPGSVLFLQTRVGKDGKHFRLYKFRTMKLDTPKYVATIDMTEPEKYITRVGRILRKLSLDELPQLVNVLKGDMSLVGPRPLIPSEEQIHNMRTRFGVYSACPGITGLAQVRGRDTVSPAEKVRYDWEYVSKFGLLMDMRVLLSTIPKAFSGSGVVENGKKNT